MLDFSEILIIGGVALVVLGPERLPLAARTVGSWVGRMQQYVSQVRGDLDREFHLADLRRIGEEARTGARSVETAVRGGVADIESAVDSARVEAMSPPGDNGWAGAGPPGPPQVFHRRYRPRPSIDDLSLEIERLKRQLAVPDGPVAGRRRLAPRARINRVRVRR
jgi:sec-independent protein translocase protein TatB